MASPYERINVALNVAGRNRTNLGFKPPRLSQGLSNLQLPSVRPPRSDDSMYPEGWNPFEAAAGVEAETREGPGGVLGTAMTALDFGRSAVVSTIKETIDTVQGAVHGDFDVSPSDWYEQATNHYGFGDLIHDERSAVGWGLVALSPWTFGTTAVLGGAVLADNIYADIAIGFLGDVALDPLTYMGATNIIARGLGGYRKAGSALYAARETLTDDQLWRMAGEAGFNLGDDAVKVGSKMRDKIDEAIDVLANKRTVSAAKRSLAQDDAGRAVARIMGLDPGMRLRVPGTGMLGRGVFRGEKHMASWLGQTRPGLALKTSVRPMLQSGAARRARSMFPDENVLAQYLDAQRAKNIPLFFRAGHSQKDLQAAVKVMRGNRRAAERLIGQDPKLAEAAGRAARGHVEFRVPAGFGKGAQVAFGASLAGRADFPISWWRASPVTGKFFGAGGSRQRGWEMFKHVKGDNPSDIFKRSNWYRVDEAVQAKAVKGITGFFRNRMSILDNINMDGLVASSGGDPHAIAAMWKTVDAARQGRGISAFYSEIKRRGTKALMRAQGRRVTSRGIQTGSRLTTEEILDLTEAVRQGDAFVRDELGTTVGINRNSDWFHNLSDRTRALDDESIMDMARDVDNLFHDIDKVTYQTFGTRMEDGSHVWAEAEALLANEGVGWIPRRMRKAMRALFGYADTKFEDWADIGGYLTAQSVKNRAFQVGRTIQLPTDAALQRAQATGYVYYDRLNVYGKGRDAPFLATDATGSVPFKPRHPSDVGKSVRRQLDDISTAAFGEPMYEGNFQTVLDSWEGGMKRAAAVQVFFRHMQEAGVPLLEVDDDAMRRIADVIVSREGTALSQRSAREAGEARTFALGAKASVDGVVDDLVESHRLTGYDAEVVRRMQRIHGQVINAAGETEQMMEELTVLGARVEEIFAQSYDGIMAGTLKVPAEVGNLVRQAHTMAARLGQIERDAFGILAPLYATTADNASTVLGGDPAALRTLRDAFDTTASQVRENITFIRGTVEDLAGDFNPGQLPLIVERAKLLTMSDRSIPELLELAKTLDTDSYTRLVAEYMETTGGRAIPDATLKDIGRRVLGSKQGQRRLASIDNWKKHVEDWRSGDLDVDHEAFIAPGVTRQVDPEEVDGILNEIDRSMNFLEVEGRTAQLLEEAGVTPRTLRKNVTTLKLTDADNSEIVGAVQIASADAQALRTEATAIRQRATATRQAAQDALPGTEGSLLRDAETLERMAFAAELEVQAAAREASDILAASKLSREVGAVLGSGKGPALPGLDEMIGIPKTPEQVEAFRDMVLDGMKGWGPWRMASGNVEMDEGMLAAASAFQKMNSPKDVNALLQMYDKALNWMKAGMIATPGFVYRNVFGAIFNAWLDGVNPNAMMRSFELARSFGFQTRQENKTFLTVVREAVAAGQGRTVRVLGGGPKVRYGAEELQNYLTLLEKGVRGGGLVTTHVLPPTIGLKEAAGDNMWIAVKQGAEMVTRPVAFWKSNFWYYQMVRSANMQAEDVIRLGIGLDAMRWGASADEALERIARSQFDYSELTSWERNVAQRVIPFYTWTRKNLPYQMQKFATQPQSYNRVLSAKRNLELASEEKGVVPDWFVQPFGIRLPWTKSGATVYTVPDIPFQDLFRFDPTGIGGPKEVWDQIMWQVSPVIKAPLEALAFRAKASGIPFRGDFIPTPRVFEDIPFLMDAAAATGLARKQEGEWQMRDNHIYFLTNMIPLLGRVRRILPNEERYQQRLWESVLSTFMGINARVQTPEAEEGWLQHLQWQENRRRADEGGSGNEDWVPDWSGGGSGDSMYREGWNPFEE